MKQNSKEVIYNLQSINLFQQTFKQACDISGLFTNLPLPQIFMKWEK